jgi:hypothetical protein
MTQPAAITSHNTSAAVAVANMLLCFTVCRQHFQQLLFAEIRLYAITVSIKNCQPRFTALLQASLAATGYAQHYAFTAHRSYTSHAAPRALTSSSNQVQL